MVCTALFERLCLAQLRERPPFLQARVTWGNANGLRSMHPFPHDPHATHSFKEATIKYSVMHGPLCCILMAQRNIIKHHGYKVIYWTRKIWTDSITSDSYQNAVHFWSIVSCEICLNGWWFQDHFRRDFCILAVFVVLWPRCSLFCLPQLPQIGNCESWEHSNRRP